MRACRECKYFKDESEFYLTNDGRRNTLCRTCYIEERLRYHRTDAGLDVSRRADRKRNTSDKKRARRAVRYAVLIGKLVRPEACENGHPGPIEAHHHRGYAPEFWLDVVWLCKNCHDKAHGRVPTGASCES
jgi:hypothetical protein